MTTVGINFGNIHSSVAINQSERGSEVVADAGGFRQLPCVVTYNEDKKSFIGVESLNFASRYPKSTICDIKTLLSCATLEEAKKGKKYDFQLVEGKNGGVAAQFQFEGKETQVSPQDVAQLLLQQLKKTAEDASGDKATKVVIAHPFHSPTDLKTSLLDAAKRIGWNDVHFVSEQAAVILAYELDDTESEDKQVITVDFGDTLQVSHVSVLGGAIHVNQVLSYPEVNAKLIEASLIKAFSGEFQRKYKLDVSESKRALIRLAAESDRIKGVLSQMQQVSVNVEGLMEGIDFASQMTRAKFEMINSGAFGQFSRCLAQAIETIGVEADYVVLSGGNCKIPKIQTLVQNSFPEKKVLFTIDPTEVHAKGAALQAKYLSERNAMIHGKKVNKYVHGLAKTVGIEAHDGSFVPLILKDTPAPLKIVKKFNVDSDVVVLNVYEGDSKVASENKKIGVLRIPDLPDQVLTKGEVTLQFHVDEAGVLSVQASQKTVLATVKFDGNI